LPIADNCIIVQPKAGWAGLVRSTHQHYHCHWLPMNGVWWLLIVSMWWGSMMSHIVESCPLVKLAGDLSSDWHCTALETQTPATTAAILVPT